MAKQKNDRSAQKEKILAMLKRPGGVTTYDIACETGSMNVSCRLREMKADGVPIKDITKPGDRLKRYMVCCEAASEIDFMDWIDEGCRAA